MTYHYHVVECPHCGRQRGRGCNLDDCTAAVVGMKPFTSSDGYKAKRALCTKTNQVFYVDFGDRELE